MSTHYHRKSDLRPELQVTLKYDDGTVVDLDACTVTFSMKDARTGMVKINAADATITDAINGKVKYMWTSDNVDTEGTFIGEFEVTFPDTKTQTFPSKGDLVIIIGGEIA